MFSLTSSVVIESTLVHQTRSLAFSKHSQARLAPPHSSIGSAKKIKNILRKMKILIFLKSFRIFWISH